jgi:hypothetical protein
VKTWAAVLHSHLGLIRSKSTVVVHLRSTTKREFCLNKNQSLPRPQNPKSFSPHPPATEQERERERAMVASAGSITHEALHRSARSPEVERTPVERSCGGTLSGLRPSIDVGESWSVVVMSGRGDARRHKTAALPVRPLACARIHPRVSAPPSSGFAVVPLGVDPKRQVAASGQWPRSPLPGARSQWIRRRWWGKSRLPFLRVRVRISELNPLLLNVAGLRSKVVASAHGVPMPLTRKGETQPGSWCQCYT